MTTTTESIRASALRSPGTNLRDHAAAAVAVAVTWRERARQRRHLASLTLEQLADIGISASAARDEAAKPFWVA